MLRPKYNLNNPYNIKKRELRSIVRERFGLIAVETFCDIGGACSIDEHMLAQSDNGKYFGAEVSIGTFLGSAIVLEKKSGRKIITRVFARNDYYSKESRERSWQFEDICFERYYIRGKTLSNVASPLVTAFTNLLMVVITVMPLFLIYNLRELGLVKACVLYIFITIARKLGEKVLDTYDVSM